MQALEAGRVVMGLLGQLGVLGRRAAGTGPDLRRDCQQLQHSHLHCVKAFGTRFVILGSQC